MAHLIPSPRRITPSRNGIGVSLSINTIEVLELVLRNRKLESYPHSGKSQGL